MKRKRAHIYFNDVCVLPVVFDCYLTDAATNSYTFLLEGVVVAIVPFSYLIKLQDD